MEMDCGELPLVPAPAAARFARALVVAWATRAWMDTLREGFDPSRRRSNATLRSFTTREVKSSGNITTARTEPSLSRSSTSSNESSLMSSLSPLINSSLILSPRLIDPASGMLIPVSLLTTPSGVFTGSALNNTAPSVNTSIGPSISSATVRRSRSTCRITRTAMVKMRPAFMKQLLLGLQRQTSEKPLQGWRCLFCGAVPRLNPLPAASPGAGNPGGRSVLPHPSRGLR